MRQGEGQPPDSVEGAIDLPGKLRGWLGLGPIQSPSGAFYAWIDEETGIEPRFRRWELRRLRTKEGLTPME